MFTVSLATVGAQAAAKTVKHTIKDGETLYIIAQKNHTTIEEVRKANDLKKGDILKIGRVLKVPENTYFPDKKAKVANIIENNKSTKLAQKINQKSKIKISSVARTYVIKSGDTLSGIAHKHNTTIAKMRVANNLKQGQILKLGQALKIPDNSYAQSTQKKEIKLAKADTNRQDKKLVQKTNQKSTTYVIKSGDTLSSIAHKYNTTIAKIREANGFKKGQILKLGKVLKMPGNSYVQTTKLAQQTNQKLIKKPSIAATYVIKSGDTLSNIARKHNTTIAKVREANGLKKGQILKLGKVLKMPVNSYAQSTEKKKIKVAKADTNRQDKKLVNALMKIESKKLATVEVRKDQKISLGDIFFGKKPKDQKDKEAKTGKSAKITKLAKNELGKKYVWGAVGEKNTFDCSGLTTYVCKKNGICIPRRAIAQSKYGKPVKRDNLKPGDLVFFDTSKRRKGYVNHVGIYIGNNNFIHASSAKKKVVITSLDKTFYDQRYKGARRVAS